MEIGMLIDSALPLILPFINKVGEGAVEKIGEDIWNLIKKTFSKKEKKLENLNEEEIKLFLREILEKDLVLKGKVECLLKSNNSSYTQNINNAGATIEKQINIGDVNGTINL